MRYRPVQTVLRDLAVVGAWRFPRRSNLGAIGVFGFAIVVIALIGRVPLISWLTFAVIVASLLLLFSGIYHGHRFLAIPLSCLGPVSPFTWPIPCCPYITYGNYGAGPASGLTASPEPMTSARDSGRPGQ